MRRIFYILVIGLLLGSVVIAFIQKKQEKQFHSHTIPAFGTLVTVIIPENENSSKIVAEITDFCQKLNHILNVYQADSEVSQLNLQAHQKPFSCSPLLWEILQAAHQAWQETEGNFDITVGPLMDLWGFRKKNRTLLTIPTETEIKKVLQHVGFDKIQLDVEQKSVFFLNPEMRLDFGGIAKGFALKHVGNILKKYQITEALLNFGGNIYVFENFVGENRDFKISVRDPKHLDDKRYILTSFVMKNSAVATSGSYENQVEIQGKMYSHIIHPKTGWPIEDKISVTIHCQDPLDSDVYSTAVFVGGEQILKKLQQRDPLAEMFILNSKENKFYGK